MSEEAKEELGRTIDRLDGFGAMLKNPLMPSDIHVKALKDLIPEIVEDFKDHFAAIFGDDPWEGHPDRRKKTDE